jgi:hypothetical protein
MTLGAIGGKRDVFLQRIAAMLALRGRGRFTDTDVAEVAQSGTPIGTEIPQPIKGLNCEYRYPFPGFAAGEICAASTDLGRPGRRFLRYPNRRVATSA